MQHTRRPAPFAWVGALTLLALAACGGTDRSTETATSSPPAPVAGTSYASQRFVPSLEVTVPDWLPVQPVADEPTFLTWLGEGVMVDRGIRFLVPVTVYQPGSETASRVPDDYLAFLRSHDSHGAGFADETTTTVDGHPTTILTATTTTSLDGSLGCPDRDLAATDCYGLQPYLALRIAVIDMDRLTLVAWARVSEGSAGATEVYTDFERMLASLRFR